MQSPQHASMAARRIEDRFVRKLISCSLNTNFAQIFLSRESEWSCAHKLPLHTCSLLHNPGLHTHTNTHPVMRFHFTYVHNRRVENDKKRITTILIIAIRYTNKVRDTQCRMCVCARVCVRVCGTKREQIDRIVERCFHCLPSWRRIRWWNPTESARIDWWHHQPSLSLQMARTQIAS